MRDKERRRSVRGYIQMPEYDCEVGVIAETWPTTWVQKVFTRSITITQHVSFRLCTRVLTSVAIYRPLSQRDRRLRQGLL